MIKIEELKQKIRNCLLKRSVVFIYFLSMLKPFQSYTDKLRYIFQIHILNLSYLIIFKCHSFKVNSKLKWNVNIASQNFLFWLSTSTSPNKLIYWLINLLAKPEPNPVHLHVRLSGIRLKRHKNNSLRRKKSPGRLWLSLLPSLTQMSTYFLILNLLCLSSCRGAWNRRQYYREEW